MNQLSFPFVKFLPLQLMLSVWQRREAERSILELRDTMEYSSDSTPRPIGVHITPEKSTDSDLDCLVEEAKTGMKTV